MEPRGKEKEVLHHSFQRIDRLVLTHQGIQLMLTDGQQIEIDALSTQYLMNWLCRHAGEIDQMARTQAEQEQEILRSLF